MPFNRCKAHEVAEAVDRDDAPYFVGREREIAAFERALKNAKRRASGATVFTIYQGAPGAGKSALRHKLAARAKKDELHINVRLQHLESYEALTDRIHSALVERGGTLTAVVASGAVAAAGKFAGEEVAQTIDEALKTNLRTNLGESGALVLSLDEAQRLRNKHADTLTDLHTIGVGIPSVLLATGLSYTSDTFSDLGISRGARDSVVEMGELTDGECAESTRKMLDDLGLGPRSSQGGFPHSAGTISKGWPQHLQGYHRAVALELLRVDGNLERADPKRIIANSDKYRAAYYNDRLKGKGVLSRRRDITKCAIVAVHGQRPAHLDDFEAVIAPLLDMSPGLRGKAKKFAVKMIKKGVVCPMDDGSYEVPIPSMVDWARDTMRDKSLREHVASLKSVLDRKG